MEKIYHVAWTLGVQAKSEKEAASIAISMMQHQTDSTLLLSVREINKHDLIANPKITLLNKITEN
jgi:hypothetical protein